MNEVESSNSIVARPLHASLSDPCLNSMVFLNDIAGRYPDAISFAPGRPIERGFKLDDISHYLNLYIDQLNVDGIPEEDIIKRLYQYGPTEGIIREQIAQMLLKTEGLRCDPEDVVVTSGAQEGMILLLRALFVDSNDVLLVPEPVYVGIIGAARLLNINIEAVFVDESGIDMVKLQERIDALEAKGFTIKAIYINADFCNPTGTTLSQDQRKGLIQLARTHKFTLLEDNPYGVFGAETGANPTIMALDLKNASVAYIGSFSKTMSPGLRTGFIVSKSMASALTKVKSMLTLNTSPICQAVAGGILLECNGDLKRHCANQISLYQNNMKHLLGELDNAFPERSVLRSLVKWNRPEGGFFLVLNVPIIVNEDLLNECAKEFGVLWTPMSMFYSKVQESNQIRLAISYLTPDEISEGVLRLRDFLQREITREATKRVALKNKFGNFV